VQMALASAHFGPHSSPKRRTFAARSMFSRVFSCPALPAQSKQTRESLANGLRTPVSHFSERRARQQKTFHGLRSKRVAPVDAAYTVSIKAQRFTAVGAQTRSLSVDGFGGALTANVTGNNARGDSAERRANFQ
jgi:hypothetical protein